MQASPARPVHRVSRVQINLAHAIVLLHDAPATEGVMHALTLVESALPPSGTPERREAFRAAYERIERSAS